MGNYTSPVTEELISATSTLCLILAESSYPYSCLRFNLHSFMFPLELSDSGCVFTQCKFLFLPQDIFLLAFLNAIFRLCCFYKTLSISFMKGKYVVDMCRYEIIIKIGKLL